MRGAFGASGLEVDGDRAGSGDRRHRVVNQRAQPTVGAVGAQQAIAGSIEVPARRRLLEERTASSPTAVTAGPVSMHLHREERRPSVLGDLDGEVGVLVG